MSYQSKPPPLQLFPDAVANAAAKASAPNALRVLIISTLSLLAVSALVVGSVGLAYAVLATHKLDAGAMALSTDRLMVINSTTGTLVADTILVTNETAATLNVTDTLSSQNAVLQNATINSLTVQQQTIVNSTSVLSVVVNQTVLNTLSITNLQCLASPITDTCLPALGTQGGDVVGPVVEATVVGLQTIPVSAVDPTPGQVLLFDGVQWAPGVPTGIALDGDVTGPQNALTVIKLQNRPISATAPTVPQHLGWSGTQWEPASIDSQPGSNIAISNTGSTVHVATTPAMALDTLTVNQTLLGTNTSCILPLQPSCYDISAQTCAGGALAVNCVPRNLELDNLLVYNLTLVNLTSLEIPIGNQTNLYTDQLYVANQLLLNGTETCVGGGSISNNCLNLGGYTCPIGVPLADSCIPASLVQYDQTVTHQLTVNMVQCTGPPLPSSCLPSLALVGDVTGELGNNTVVGLQRVPLSSELPTDGEALVYNASLGQWTPMPLIAEVTAGSNIVATPAGGGVVVATASSVLFTALQVTGSSHLGSSTVCDAAVDASCLPALAGDVTGAPAANTVIKLQGVPVASTGPTLGQVLAYNGSHWLPAALIADISAGANMVVTSLGGGVVQVALAPAVSITNLTVSDTTHLGTTTTCDAALDASCMPALAGDATGPPGSNTVTKLQGHAVSAAVPSANQFLQYVGSTWTPTTVTLTLAGDVTGAIGANTVTKLQGVAVSPAAPATGQALVYSGSAWTATDMVAEVTAGTNIVVTPVGATVQVATAPAVSFVNLTVSDTTSLGTNTVCASALDVSCMPPLVGDANGPPSANTVTKLQGVSVSATTPTSNQILQYVGSAWTPSTIALTLAGDATGPFGANSVVKIQGVAVSASTPTTNQFLRYTGSQWAPSTVSLTLSGDVVGTLGGSNTVVGIQMIPVAAVVPVTGQMLGYNGSEYVPASIASAGPGSNIVVTNVGQDVFISTTSSVAFSTLAVSESTLLGTNTTCITPLQPSCYDISGQTCTTPVSGTCLPADATFTNLSVHNLTIFGGALEVPLGNQTSLAVQDLYVDREHLNGNLTCEGGGAIDNGCLNLGGYSCPLGHPLADSCIPASLVQYDQTVTHQLTVNLVTCSGPALPLPCFPSLVGDVTGTLGATTVAALQGVSVSASAPSSGNALVYDGAQWAPAALAGDVTGSYVANTVTKIQGVTVSATGPTTGQPLAYSGTQWISTALGGDISGAITAVTVGKIQGVSISGVAPISGQALVYTGSAWTASTLAGDVTGSYVANTVTKIQNVAVASGAPGTGQALAYSGTQWVSTAFGGDVTGAIGALTVGKIQNVAVSATTPTANQYLQYDSGTSSWKPSTFALTLAGDVTGSYSANTVTKIQGYAVSASAPGTGQPLTYSGTQWVSTAFGGDVSGSVGAITVGKIQGVSVSVTAPTANQYLQYDSGTTSWKPTTFALTLAGDVTGPYGSNTVTKLQNVAVSATTPTLNQFLQYDGSQWKATSIALTLGGDVTGSFGANTVGRIQGYAVAATTPTDGTVMAWDAVGNHWTPQGDPVYYGTNTQLNSGTHTITLGYNASTYGVLNAISLGNQALAAAESAVCIGTSCTAQGTYGICIGISCIAGSPSGIALGESATVGVLGDHSIAVGASADASNAGYAVAIGRNARADVTGGVSVGYGATTNGIASSISLGTGASPLNTAHALALVVNAASVLPGTLGLTVNGAANVVPLWSALYASTGGAGPTVLTATSAHQQAFTTAQTVTLPVVSTLQLGFSFIIVNRAGSGNVVVQSSGGNTVVTITPGSWAEVVCILTSGTTAASWFARSGGAASLAGDDVGPLTSNTVEALWGVPIDSTTPLAGQALVYNGTEWTPTSTSGFTLAGDVTGTISANTVVKIQGRSVSSSAPNNGAYMVWDATASQWAPLDNKVYAGTNTQTNSGTATVTIGPSATTTGSTNGVALGTSASAKGASATAIGQGTVANADNCFAGGTGATCSTTGTGSVALGSAASATGFSAVAVGDTSLCSTAGGVAVGASASVSSAGIACVAVGYSASSTAGSQNVVLGAYATVAADGATAIGAGATVSGTSSTALGGSATTDFGGTGYTQATAIGSSSRAYGNNNIAIGYQAQASTAGTIAIGSSSLVANTSSLGIGTSVQVFGANTVVLGNSANGASPRTVVVGISSSSSSTSAADNVIVGYNIVHSNTRSNVVVIGSSATVGGTSVVVVGKGGNGGNNCVSIGTNAVSGNQITNTSSVAVGDSASVNAQSSVGVGASVSVIAANAVAVGASSVANVASGVALGASATTNGIATSVAIGASASPADTAHALAFAINSASVVPGTLGLTVNAASYVVPLYSSLYTTTAGAGPTTLTATSAQQQYFTTAQTVTLPVTSTLQLGFYFTIVNAAGSGTVTVQSSGANTVIALAAGTWAEVTCILTSGTTAASWNARQGGGTNLAMAGDVTGTVGANTVTKLQGRTLVSTAPNNGAAMIWNSASSQWQPQDTPVAYGTNTLTNSGTNTVTLGPSATTSGATSSVAVGNTATATSNTAVAVGPNAVANVVNGVALGSGATTNAIATSVAIGAGASPTNTAHALAFAINSASVLPGTLGLTVNGAGYVVPMHSSLYTTTSGAGPTTLTVTSSQQQYFTTAQTVVLPVTSTLQTGFFFTIVNAAASGTVTVQSSGGNTVTTLSVGDWAEVTCILTSGTTAASWSARVASNGGSVTLAGDVTGAAGANTVVQIQGFAVSSNTPTNGDVMVWDATGSQWIAQENPVYYGTNTQANSGTNGVTLGANATTSGATSSVAIGIAATGRASSGVAIGPSATVSTTGTSSVAAGDTAMATGASAVAIGKSSVADVSSGVAIGDGATTNGIASSISLGASASPLSTASALAISVNSDSAAAGGLGVTLNGAARLIDAYTSWVASTTTSLSLTATSARTLRITSGTPTITLPVVTTLQNGFYFIIINLTSSARTIRTSGAVTKLSLAANTWAILMCINTAGGTGTASWNALVGGAAS